MLAMEEGRDNELNTNQGLLAFMYADVLKGFEGQEMVRLSYKEVSCAVSHWYTLPVVVVVVSYIQRIGCQPEKTTLHGGQSRSWSAEQGKENKRKSLAAYPPPPPPALLVRRK